MTLPATPFRMRFVFPFTRLPPCAACSVSALQPILPSSCFVNHFLALNPCVFPPFFTPLLLCFWMMMHLFHLVFWFQVLLKIKEAKKRPPPPSPKRRLRRTSTRRSGYAFSHQHGFGALIMSGRNMRPKSPFATTGTFSPNSDKHKHKGL